MARQRTNKHVKGHQIMVALNDHDFAALTQAAERASTSRGEHVGRATLLRELAMPRVHRMVSPATDPATTR